MNSLRRLLIAVFLITLTPSIGYAMPWSWDMFRQVSPQPQRSQAPATPKGIVSVKGKPYYAPDRAHSAEIKNPYAANEKSIKRGKAMFLRFCATCHGATGKGEGLVGKKYVPPTDLTSGYVQDKKDGEIYDIVTNGGLGIMPSYGDSVDKSDRWHIVNYIKHVLKDVKPAE